MKIIDIENWGRKSHYEWFSSFSNPSFAVTVKMDITMLYNYCKKNKYSSFASIAFLVGKCLNGLHNFRYRILGDQVVLIDRANVCYTAKADGADYVNKRIEGEHNFSDFSSIISQQMAYIKENKPVQKNYNETIIDDIYCTCTPWLDFVSVVQPYPDNNHESGSIPRVCWGKYSYDNDKVFMPLNLTMSHSLLDGKDASDAVELLQKFFNSPQEFLV